MAQGDILYRGASVWRRLAAGASGKFLKTQGAGADPIWDTPAGSGNVTTSAILTAHQVILGNGTTDVVNLGALGASGQVLTSNGAGSDPSWQAAGTGTVTHTGNLTANELVVGNGTADVKVVAATDGQIPIGKTSDGSVNLATITAGSGITVTNGSGSVTVATSVTIGTVLLEQHTASSSSTLDFTTAITSSYDDYDIHFVGLVPASNNVTFSAQFSSDGGANWNSTSNYYSASVLVKNDGTTTTINSNPGSAFNFASGVTNTSTRGVNGRLRMTFPLSTSLDKAVWGDVSYSNQTNAVGGSFSGLFTVSGTAFNAIKFAFSSGAIASGTIRIYGCSK